MNSPNDEPALDAAIREFREETGVQLKDISNPSAPSARKAASTSMPGRSPATSTPAKLVSNTFDLEWPPKSGRMKSFPEVDKGAWYTLDAARAIINPAQIAFLDELAETLHPPKQNKKRPLRVVFF